MNRKFLNKVTVTGADDKTDIKELLKIAEEYPFVEFGILISKSSTGNHPRFPSVKWIEEFSTACLESKILPNVAGHVCGSWVNEIFLGKLISFEIPRVFSNIVSRWQLNTHGIKHTCNISHFLNIIKAVNSSNQQIIFQFDEANTETIVEALNKELNVSALYDMSHGAGVLPKNWKLPSDSKGNILSIPTGFAGGLSPENVKSQLIEIADHIFDFINDDPECKILSEYGDLISSKGFWIDAETKLRSQYLNNDSGDQQFIVDYFDLNKVRKFLEEAKPYVI
jgi:hypothetical protein